MSRKRTIIRNTLSNLGMQILSAGLPFLILPYMLRYWGADTYGLLVLAFSVQTFVQFLNGAIALTSMKYVSEIYELQDFKRLNAVINVFWVVTFLNNLFVSSVLIVMGLFGLDWLNIAPPLHDTAQLVFLEMGCFGVVAGCFTFIDGVMYGLQRIHNNNLWRVSESLVAAVTALAIMHFNGTLVTYVFVISLYPILTRMVQFFYLKKSLPFFSLNVRKYFDRSELKRLSGFSAFQIVNQVADILLYNAQKLIVQKGLGSAALTTYEVANKPNMLFQNFISLPLSAILPACSAAYARNDLSFLETMLTMGTRVYLVATLPGIFALIVLMPEFIGLWLGPDYAGAVPVARLFLLSLLIACPFKIFSHMMVGKARVFEYGLTKLTYAVIGIPVSFYLISRIGIIGGVLITFGYWLLVDMPTNLYIMHAENISTLKFLANIAPILAMLFVEYAFLQAGILLGFGNTWIEFFLVSGISIGAVVFLWFFLVLKREERALVGFKF